MYSKTSSGVSAMSASVQTPRPTFPNRRGYMRQKVHVPAYATFSGNAQGEMLDLYEVLDISEAGVAIQCSAPVEINRPVNLTLDLAEATGQICATARVVWSDSTGRVGLSLPTLPASSARRLKQWLFLNAMVAATNVAFPEAPAEPSPAPVLRQNYTDMLAAACAVQKEARSLGDDLEAVLSLIASRSQSLLRASGAAIALAGKGAGIMICRASAGESAPPVGAILEAGSGFSGECVRTGKALRCDDAETDDRVDPESCRALGFRSILATPVRSATRVFGLLEVFSPQPSAFGENDNLVLQRFAVTVLAAINRATPAPDSFAIHPDSPKPFSARPGSVLFAHAPEEGSDASWASGEKQGDEDRLPRSRLWLLMAAAVTIGLAATVINFAPRIQELVKDRQNVEPTVLASSQPTLNSKSRVSVDSANVKQLRELAARGDPAAENALGLLYAMGDAKQAVKRDEAEAARWFTRAAEHGSASAQYKLGLLCWGGHGVPKDPNRAYFWAVLARAGGVEGSKDLAKVLASGMTRAQSAAIEQQAEVWYQQHESHDKPKPGR